MIAILMKQDPQNGRPDITLHDVMAHQQMHLQIMREEFAKVDKRFQKLEKRIDGIDVRLDVLEKKVDHIDHRLIIVETKIDNIDERLDNIEIIPSILKHLRTKP
jgi:peptidoglycan hydrolase CwlO-like protein